MSIKPGKDQALAAYQEHHPDLVTMDITMPIMDGITCIEELIKIDPNATIVVCSAMGQKEIVTDALKKGAKHFLIKPFEEKYVAATVRSVINMV